MIDVGVGPTPALLRVMTSSRVMTIALVALAGCSFSAPPVSVAPDEAPPKSPTPPSATSPSLPAGPYLPEPACGGTPAVGPRASWRHGLTSPIIAALAPQHRGIDLIVDAAATVQPIIGEIHYGIVDKALEDEQVDLFACRAGSWQPIGSAITDGEGRFELDLRDGKRLPIGQRAIYASVAGDRTGVEFVALVAPIGSWMFASDVDGTLTSSENAFPESLVTGAPVSAWDGAAQALTTLKQRGYLPVYITSRGQVFSEDTRTWLEAHGLPRGPIRLNEPLVTLPGQATADYKFGVLAAIEGAGLSVKVGIGNRATDAQAYDRAGLSGKQVFLKLPEFQSECAPAIASGGAVGFDSYAALTPTLAGLPLAP
jgi:hypothetical protein